MSTLPLTNGTAVARMGSTAGWTGLSGPPDYVSATYLPGDLSEFAVFQLVLSAPLAALPAFLILNLTGNVTPALTGTEIADDTIQIWDATNPITSNAALNTAFGGTRSYSIDTTGMVLADLNAGLYFLRVGAVAVPSSYATGAYVFTYAGLGTTNDNGATSPWGPTPPYNLDTGNGTSVPGFAEQSGVLTVNVTGPDGPMWASITPDLFGRGDVIVVFPRVDECAASVSESFGEGYTDSVSTTGLEPQSATLSSAHTIKIDVSAGTGSTPVAVFARGEGIAGASTGRYNANVDISAVAVDPAPSTLTISALSLSYDTTGGVDSFAGALTPETQEQEMTTLYLGDTLTFWAQLSQYSTGAAFDATGSPAYRVYEETTDTPIATGSMAVQDDTNTTGFYRGQISIAGPDYEVGKCYCVRVGATVDAIAQAGIVERFIVRVNPVTATATAVWDTLDYGDAAGRATTVGGQLAQTWRFLFNKNQVNKLAATQTVYKDDSATVMLSGPIVVNDSYSDRSKLS